MKDIWLIRHGESLSNAGKKTTHPGTSVLTQKGLLQARCIASYVKDKPDIIIHSAYTRAWQTAEPTIQKFPDSIVQEWPVQEFVYLSHVRYMETTKADRRVDVDLYWDECNPVRKDSADAESFAEFIDRVGMIAEKLTHNEGRIMMFTHGHVIRAMLWRVLTGRLQKDKAAMAQYRSLRQALYIPNAAILKISVDAMDEVWMSPLITAHLTPELMS